jgi:hypothetical protein
MRNEHRGTLQREREDDFELSKAQLKELKRRVADSLDPTRYVIASPFSPRFTLFYCPSDGMFIMNEIPDGAMFKRKAEAVAVARVLEGRRRKRGSLQVIKVKKTRRRVQVLDEVRAFGRVWKPSLRRQN